MGNFIDIKGLFPSLYEIIPGWIPGMYYCVTGATGTGKSKFTRYCFAEYPYWYCKTNNIPLQVIYFALEESEEFFWISMLLDEAKRRFGISLSYYQYKKFHEGMTQEMEEQVNSLLPKIEDMKRYIKVIDSVTNPTGLLKETEKVMLQHGKMTIIETIIDNEKNEIQKKKFIPNDPNMMFIVVADHLGLLQPENNKFGDVKTKHDAITKWSSEYVLQILLKIFNCIVTSVHQQEMAGENNDAYKLNRLEPSESKLGDNKIVGRDYMVTLGLFNPAKAGLNDYLGYRMSMFNGRFRSLHILKHRFGEAFKVKALLMSGIGNQFMELPKPEVLRQPEELKKYIS